MGVPAPASPPKVLNLIADWVLGGMLTLLCAFRRLWQDFYQLLSPTVSVLRGGAYGELYTLENFITQEQLSDPRLWIDIKALMGDYSDNVPGLKVRSGARCDSVPGCRQDW